MLPSLAGKAQQLLVVYNIRQVLSQLCRFPVTFCCLPCQE
jgi:hypothetical protein